MSEKRLELPTGVIRDAGEIVPRVGGSGLFKVKPPYNLTLSEDVEYTVTTVITVAGYMAQGKDPWAEVYAPLGANTQMFEQDRSNNRTIITLQSGIGETFVIPTGSVQMLPAMDGVRYVVSNFLVNLGPLPESEDLAGLAADLKALVEQRLGMASFVETVVTSAPLLVKHESHAAFMTARNAIIQERMTIREQFLHLQQQHQRLMAQHQLLQDHVRDKLLEEETGG